MRKGISAADITQVLDECFQQEYGRPANDRMREKFVNAILTRDAVALEFISNGLNEASKRAFCRVTGVALPPQQGLTWKAIRAWGGISDEQERLRIANDRLEAQMERLQGKMDVEQSMAALNGLLDQGYNRVVHSDRKYLLVNEEGRGYNLSQRGTLLPQARHLLEAMIEEREARAALAANTAPVATGDHSELCADPDFRM